MSAIIRSARPADLDAVKLLCDAHKRELGFVLRPSLAAAITQGEIIIAADAGGQLLGLVHFHHRRDAQTTLYHLVVHERARSQGLGRALIDALQADGIRHGKGYIQLKCPVELPANVFYARAGFAQVTCEAGKARALNVWRLPLGPAS